MRTLTTNEVYSALYDEVAGEMDASPLAENVLCWLAEYCLDVQGDVKTIQEGDHYTYTEYDVDWTPLRDAMADLMQGGCASGVVGHLIYHNDTTRFYQEHKATINSLLAEMQEETGLSTKELFGDKWDAEDPLALETQNQNLLAWFGFEEVAQQVANVLDW